jgi:hypothetical protein
MRTSNHLPVEKLFVSTEQEHALDTYKNDASDFGCIVNSISKIYYFIWSFSQASKVKKEFCCYTM